MIASIPKSLSNALLITCLAFLAGCATGPAHYAASDSTRASFQALQTTDPGVQAARFGAYAKAAGRSFVGTLPDGQLAACAYRWEIPGVVIEEHCRWPYNYLMAFQYNPESRKLDVYNLHANRAHIRELTVLPDGSVEWPTALLGLEPVSRVTLDENGALDRVFPGSGERIALRDVPRAEYESVLADARARKQFEEESRSRARIEFMQSITSGLRGVSAQLRAENEAKRLRDEQMRSAMIRAKAAEMHGTSKRNAEQQSAAKVESQRRRESDATAQRQAARSDGDTRSVGTITVVDDTEAQRKLERQVADLNRKAAADSAAQQKRLAERDAREKASVAEFEKVRAKARAEREAAWANCAARGVPKANCSGASRQ